MPTDDYRAQSAEILRELRHVAAEAASTIAIEVADAIAERTPVDTGRLRANWIPRVGRPQERHLPRLAAEGAARAGRREVEAAGRHGSLAPRFVTNALPYADSVNSGHAAREPEGFVQRGIAAGLQRARVVRAAGRRRGR